MTRFRVRYERIIDADKIGDAVTEMMIDLYRALNKASSNHAAIEEHLGEYIQYEEVK